MLARLEPGRLVTCEHREGTSCLFPEGFLLSRPPDRADLCSARDAHRQRVTKPTTDAESIATRTRAPPATYASGSSGRSGENKEKQKRRDLPRPAELSFWEGATPLEKCGEAMLEGRMNSAGVGRPMTARWWPDIRAIMARSIMTCLTPLFG